MYSAGDQVVLLDVPKIREDNDSYERDLGWRKDFNDMIGDVFQIQRVDHTRSGRFVYQLWFAKHDQHWWVEENWVSEYQLICEESDKQLDEFLSEF